MRLIVLRQLENGDCQMVTTLNVQNVERDDETQVTVYGDGGPGTLHYVVLDQELINKIKSV